MPISWNPALFKVDIELMDTQHEKLFNIINELYDSYSKSLKMPNATTLDIEKTLDFFIQYSIEHFKDEEALMEKYNYPDLTNHKFEHEKFMKEMYELMDQFKSGQPIKRIMLDLYSKSYKWLCEHISSVDTKAGNYIKSQM